MSKDTSKTIYDNLINLIDMTLLADDDTGITEAWSKSGRKFTLEDIDNPIIYADYLHQKILYDELFRDVVAVRTSSRAKAYFRLRPDYSDGNRVDPGEKNKLHNATVKEIYDRLKGAKSIEVHTVKWENHGAERRRTEQTIWQSHAQRMLSWKCDPLTRVWLDRTRYFQPDVSGFDPIAAYPGPNNRWVIIEVVHHHWPDPSAWDALVSLSKANHLVLFYFVRDKKSNNWVNKNFGQAPYVIKVTYYILDGQLYKDSSPISAPSGTADRATWIKLHVMEQKDVTLDKELAAK